MNYLFIHNDVEAEEGQSAFPMPQPLGSKDTDHSDDNDNTHLRLTSKSAKSLWVPDTHFVNEKRAYKNAF